MGTCTRLNFSGLEKNPDRTGDRPILTFMICLIKSQLWGTDGHLHAPRFFRTGKKSRPHREQANLNFHVFFDQKPIMGNRWAPARASIFWGLDKNPDTYGDRPILTFMMLFNQRPIMGSRWAPARATFFLDLDQNHDTYRDRPI